MAIDVKPSPGGMTWLIGRNDDPRKVPFGTFRARFLLLSAVVTAGFLTWMTLSGPSDAGSQPVPVRSPVLTSAQQTSRFDPRITTTQATLAMPADESAPAQPAAPAEAITPAEPAPVGGLKITSQSWRRGGLGSKALITFTLRNRNDYAVKDIEISCAFARRDGSHLTDRTRVIHDTVNMKSRKTFARLHVGFVNINANKAKCALVTASHI
ncbi:hypothetical protein SAMN05443248_5061 [Bradyrhizobium erythrophlei]|uniref:Uncharacterized protein n=1 Tax=Bradyrhizobium erythrophlei TaxID=1437360 RepID=A0A1M5TKY5_9BRAD|nr:hypothetical protein SAMN05443248_5061 [Bradyrhizobium erythrophlei]